MSTSHRTRARRAALAAAALPVLVVLAGCGQDTADDPSPVAGGSSSSPTPEPSDSVEPSETASADPGSGPAGQGSDVALPLYFVGDTPAGPRLFREFQSARTADPLLEAAERVTSGDAQDPDYRTLFPAGGSVSAVSAGDGMLVVELGDDVWTRAGGLARDRARLAVQQLVRTLQAVQQARVPVTVLLDGEPTTLLGIDAAAGLDATDPLEVLGQVNVTTPEQGATVSGSFRADGVANSPEANVPWELRRDGRVVRSGFATAEGWMDKLYPWRTDEIDVSDLAPGRYTFVASTDDPSGGEGFGPTTDSKELTVE